MASIKGASGEREQPERVRDQSPPQDGDPAPGALHVFGCFYGIQEGRKLRLGLSHFERGGILDSGRAGWLLRLVT